MKSVFIASRAGRLKAAVLVTVMMGVICALPVHATIIKSPPWADEFAAKYPDPAGNGLDTRRSAEWADDRLDSIGYFSTWTQNGTAPTSMNSGHAQADAVWAFFGHGGAGVARFYDMSTGATSRLYAVAGIGNGCGAPNDCISDHFGQISKMKLALFAGCETARDKNDALPWDGSLLRAATGGALVDAALGFQETISWPSMDYWADEFFQQLQARQTIAESALAAQEYVKDLKGVYNGTDTWRIRGDPSVTIRPAGYGS